MANLVDINQLYHFLSKSPVGLDTTLSKVRNKSGHTLTTDDIFGEEIPACFVPDDVKQLNNIPKGSLNKNDLAAIAYGSSNARYFYYNGSEWVERIAWQDHELFFNKSSEYLNNGTHYNSAKKTDAVIEYHKERFGYFVTDNNNNGSGSNKMSVRVLKDNDADIISGNFVSQFLQSTDKYVSGIPSLGYNPLVFNTSKGTILLEDANDTGSYISNSYAGVIQFNSQGKEATGTGHVENIKISVWEYIGKSLTKVLGGFASKDLGLKYGVVDSLDNVPDDKKEGWIYFVPSTNPDTKNVYDEFIWADDNWEQIGSTAVTIPPPPAAGDYLKLENDTYKVKHSKSIIDDGHATVPTTTAVYNFIKEQETHEQWHNTNNYTHIDVFDGNGLAVVLDNQQQGDVMKGFFLTLPRFSQLEKFKCYGYCPINSYGQPSGNGNTNFDMFAKVIDLHTEKVIAVSDKAIQSDEIASNGFKRGNAEFVFSNNQPILLGGEEYKVIFSVNADVDDLNPSASLKVAWGNANTTLFAEKENNVTTKRYLVGEISTHYINQNGEKTPAPATYRYNTGGQYTTFTCKGVGIFPKFVYNKGEFDSLSIHISDLYNSSVKDITDHINDTDIHFSKSDITDTYFGEEKTLDFSQGASPKGAQGIAYAQICTAHVLPENSYVSKITVPQHPSPSTNEITANEPIYLVIYGDKTGSNDWEFVAHSTNTDMQVPNGLNMVFEFEKDTDIGLYKKYRFFYVKDVSTTPQLPKTGQNYTGVKMAFPSRDIDKDCHVIQTNGGPAERHTYPAIISYSSLESTLHKDNDERHITQEERDRWNNSASVQTGINIGTEDNLITPTPTARIANEGFLKGVTAINFRGAFVNVVKKDNTTIDVWINEDNNCPEASTASSEGVTTKTKYVFGSSTNAWELPVDNGTKFTSCHLITEDQKITIKGTKKGITCSPVSVNNLTSKIRVEVYGDNEQMKKSFETPNYITRNLPVKGDSELGSSLNFESKGENDGITISITNLKIYSDVDESGFGWDASNGYIPNTVSFNCDITLDTDVILPNGGTYEARVYLDTYDDNDSLIKSTTLHDGKIYYAYKPLAASITGSPDGTPSVEIRTIDGEELIETRWVSGVEYIAKDTKFEVAYKQMENTTYMVADYETIRGGVTLSSCSCDDSADITGSTNDKENTIIPAGTKYFTLGDNNSVQESLAATHTAYSVGGNDIEKGKYLHAKMNIWSTGTDDTYNTAYFEKEQTKNEGYGRILGHIDAAGTLVIDSPTFVSEEPLSGDKAKQEYKNQAKVYDGKLVYGEGTGDKFYVRKFKKNNTDDASQLKGFNITIPGIEMDSDKMDVWYFMIDDDDLGLSMGQKISATSPEGIGDVDDNNSNKVYAAINVNALPVAPIDNKDFYIVVVLKDNTVSITGDIIIS